jgi:hypothetical protein
MHECVSSVTDPFRNDEGTLMDTGKILIGIALVMFSAALMVTPSSAAGSDASPGVGNGNAFFITGNAVIADSLLSTGADGSPVIAPAQATAGACEDRRQFLSSEN